MPINAPSPLESFQMGKEGGRANSPITGIGLAIQNIVDDARKKGLLKAQSQFQMEGADQNAILKEGRAEERLGLPKTTTFIGATEDQDRTYTGTRGEDVKSLPKEDKSSALMEAILRKMMPGETDPASTDKNLTGSLMDRKVARANQLMQEEGLSKEAAIQQASTEITE